MAEMMSNPGGQICLDSSILPPNAVLLIPSSLVVSTPTINPSVIQHATFQAPVIMDAPRLPPVVGHCLFCMRRLVESGPGLQLFGNGADDEWQLVPKANVPPELLPTFNRILPLLHSKWMWKRDPVSVNVKVCTSEKGKPASGEENRASSESEESLPKDFPHLPSMCELCAPKFLDLDRIIGELNQRIGEIRGVIQDSKKGGSHGWRGEQFEKDLLQNKALPKISKDKTINFYKDFGVMATDEAPKSPDGMAMDIAIDVKQEKEDEQEQVVSAEQFYETGPSPQVSTASYVSIANSASTSVSHVLVHVGEPGTSSVLSCPLEVPSASSPLTETTFEAQNNHISLRRDVITRVSNKSINKDNRQISGTGGVIAYKSKPKIVDPNTTHWKTCEQCGEKVKAHKMRAHLIVHHCMSADMSCRKCSLECQSWKELLEHLRSHKQDPESLVCYICDDNMKFALHESLEVHFFTEHNVGKLTKCDHCEATFLIKRSLENHMKVHK